LVQLIIPIERVAWFGLRKGKVKKESRVLAEDNRSLGIPIAP